LHRRRAFGWPESTPVPRIELEATARHFGLDAEKWAEVCRRTAYFYARTAYVRYDPAERLDLGGRYDRAARDLAAGRPLHESGLPSLSMPIPILQRASAQAAAVSSSATSRPSMRISWPRSAPWSARGGSSTAKTSSTA